MATKAPKPRAPALEWPRRPSPSQHKDFGRRLTWRSRCRGYRIDRFNAGSGLYIAQSVDAGGKQIVIGRPKRALRAAQRLCQQHTRKKGLA